MIILLRHFNVITSASPLKKKKTLLNLSIKKAQDTQCEISIYIYMYAAKKSYSIISNSPYRWNTLHHEKSYALEVALAIAKVVSLYPPRVRIITYMYVYTYCFHR